MQYGESTDAVDRVRIPAEAVRREYGAVRIDLSAASATYVKHEITFKIGLRIAADRGGNPQVQYGYSTHTVRIPRGSRRIEHPPRSAASVRRCERGISSCSNPVHLQICIVISSSTYRLFHSQQHISGEDNTLGKLRNGELSWLKQHNFVIFDHIQLNLVI